MPLKLNIAMSRKMGEPNYGSRGISVGLEMEVDSALVDQPRQLHQRIARLFRLAKQEMQRELGSPEQADPLFRSATINQVRAIHAIANRRSLNLDEELHNRFGVGRPQDLTLDEASQLIDAIKPSVNGETQQ